MTENDNLSRADLETAARRLARDPAARAQATRILREELRTATASERERIITLIRLLDRSSPTPH